MAVLFTFISSSRWSGRIAEWCLFQDHCSDPAIACGDLREDVEAAQSLSKQFPSKVKLVRYEDLSLNTLDTAREMFSFLNLPWHYSIQRYIASHTKPMPGKMMGMTYEYIYLCCPRPLQHSEELHSHSDVLAGETLP